MQTHIKDTLATLTTFVVLSLTVSAGMVFKLVGIPSITILNFPFQYFWFVVGAWVSLFVGFAIYHRYVGRLEAEKATMRKAAGPTDVDPNEAPDTAPAAGED